MCHKGGLFISLISFVDLGIKETDATAEYKMSNTVFLSCQLYSLSLYRQ